MDKSVAFFIGHLFKWTKVLLNFSHDFVVNFYRH
jgi:hypothetical protein